MKTPTPIACTLTPDELRARRDQLLPGLVERAQSSERLDDRIRLRFPPEADIVTAIARVIDAERHCCRFLGFTLTVSPDLGEIVLEISAPPEARTPLAELVNL